MTYIRPELVVLIPVMMIIGKGIKELPLIQDEAIPVILGIVSILVCAIYVLSITNFDSSGTPQWQQVAACMFDVIVQGILVAGTATWGHQCYKQWSKWEELK